MNLARIAEPHPESAPALLTDERRVTYGELRDAVARARGGLVKLGVAPGDRVAVVLPNSPELVVAYLAALGVGAVAVPMNPMSPSAELGRQLARVEPRVTVADAAAARSIEDLGQEAGGRGALVAPTDAGGDVSTDALLAEAPTEVVERDSADPAALLFTAGTGGAPRAACLTHGNIEANLAQMQAVPSVALRPSDVSLGVLPMFHVFGLNVVLGLSLYAGAAVVLADRFDPAATMASILDHKVSVLAGAPQMFEALAARDPATGSELKTVRLAISGAAPLSEETQRSFTARFGVKLLQGYGLTEASPVVTVPTSGDEPPRSVGSPLPEVEVRLVDAEGLDALQGDPGEIWVRGPNVFAGYWRDNEATSEVLTSDRWLRTGDVALRDDDGFYYLVDRAKDLIIVSGFNVYPAEVEDVIAGLPGVSAAAVVGDPDPSSGEAVHAYVVVEAGARLSEEEVVAHCRSQLARYKCPDAVSFVDEIPLGLTGKLLRRRLH